LTSRCRCLSLVSLDVEAFSIDDGIGRIGDNPFLARQPSCDFGNITEVTA